MIPKSLHNNNNYNNSSITTYLGFLMNSEKGNKKGMRGSKRENEEKFICYFYIYKSQITSANIFFQNSQNSTDALRNILATKNNAAINIHVQVFLWIYVFISFGYTSRMKFLCHMVIECLTVWGIMDCFLKWLHYFCMPIRNVWGL